MSDLHQILRQQPTTPEPGSIQAAQQQTRHILARIIEHEAYQLRALRDVVTRHGRDAIMAGLNADERAAFDLLYDETLTQLQSRSPSLAEGLPTRSELPREPKPEPTEPLEPGDPIDGGR